MSRNSILPQIILIVCCIVLIVLAAIVWINLAGDGGLTASSSSLPSTPGLPTSSLLPQSSDIPSVPQSSSVPSTSSTVSSGSLSALPPGVVITPQEDVRFEHAPGPNTAGDGKIRCYLTFDDGPSSTNTPKILEILDQYNVKATFFVVGKGNMAYVKDAYDRGHAIGLHANEHTYSKIYKSTDAYFADLELLGYKVKNAIGFTPNIIRFPGGSSNTVSRGHCKGIMTTLSQEVETRGYYYFDWNVDSTDASGNKIPVDNIVSEVKKYATGKRDICILMHDTYGKETTVQALPQIIEHCRDKGYEFCILNKYAPGFHHGINN